MKLTYQDAIARKIKRALKQGDTLKARYYQERVNVAACVSYEQFIGSWAGQEWLKKNT